MNWLTTVSEPLGGATLNWNVSGPGFVSVAVTVQVIDVPITWGDAAEARTETIRTTALPGVTKHAGNNVTKVAYLANLMESVRTGEQILTVYRRAGSVKMCGTAAYGTCWAFLAVTRSLKCNIIQRSEPAIDIRVTHRAIRISKPPS